MAREGRRPGFPLNCIDKGLLALHNKDDYIVNHAILTIEGYVDPVRLKSALLAVLLRHPTLRSTVHTGLFRQMREARVNYSRDMFAVADLEMPQDSIEANHSQIGALYDRRLCEWINTPLDPSNELPCRVLLLRKTFEKSSLVFTCHHSAADGLHCLRFIHEVMQEYNEATHNSSRSTYSVTEERGDELVALGQACRPGVKHFYLKMIASLAHRFLLAPLSPNGRICRRSSRRSAEIDFCQGALNPHELTQIKSRSKSVGGTVNDVLLAACFRTVEQWNNVHGKPSRKISIMVPVSIGNPVPPSFGANQVSFISVPTTQKERRDPEELLWKVKQRTSHLLKNGIAFSIVYATYLCSRLPPPIPKAVAQFLLTTRIYLDSILLTNLGVIWPQGITLGELGNAGNAVITRVLGLPPVVSPMGISLCADTYHGHLYVALAYKTAHFSKAEARTFLTLYFHELRSYQRTPEGLLMPEVRYLEEREAVAV